MDQRIPVTVLTGFLGSGKTTLLNRILREFHGRRLAVIENEFGETGIDNDLLLHADGEQIVEMNNGCICCTVRGDLVRILQRLHAQRAAGLLQFERVLIETTGLADPSPVAQTFFVEEDIAANYMLDAILTTVDAKHGLEQLQREHEAQEQVGFADRILITKTDLVDAAALASLCLKLRTINPRAPIHTVLHGQAEIGDLIDIQGFSLDTILDIAPDFLQEDAHSHDDDISAFVYTAEAALDRKKIGAALSLLVELYGPQLLRYKGILNIAGLPNRLVMQGVHMLTALDMGAPWEADTRRETRMVFIGRDLPKAMLRELFDSCCDPPEGGAS